MTEFIKFHFRFLSYTELVNQYINLLDHFISALFLYIFKDSEEKCDSMNSH